MNGDGGFKVPGWVVAMLTAMTLLIAFGITIGGRLQAQVQQNLTTDYRLCRIERALHIDPWETCHPPELP